MRFLRCSVILSVVLSVSAVAQDARIRVDASKPGHAISPTLWGIFFEDINLSADGGIYPELVRNRSFEDADNPENWKFSSLQGRNEAVISQADVHGQPVPLNPFNRKSLKVTADGSFALQNEGYWGMNFVKGEGYTFRMAARGVDFTGTFKVKALSSTGDVLAQGEITAISKSWDYCSVDLVVSGSDPKGKLELTGQGKGTVFLDMISLLPKKTWKNHGLRTDLADSIAALSPKFLRFPGGCWVEGDDFAHMYYWKNTIGNIDSRTPLWNIWNYNATHGVGYHEYLQLAEDLGAEPLFCINIGMSHKETIPMDRMAQWVQDALDAIEYANGPVDSVWGSMRAAAGHPAPFNLKYLEIGNENGSFAGYVERWKLFYKAIKAMYPSIQLIANGWANYGDCPADIVDDHFYSSPEWFMRHAGDYDKTDRKGPRVFVGEYAVTQKCGLGNLRGAIGEAAFMTGLERNSDVVCMASYAPLFVNLNHRSWNPDLINFDSSRWYGLPSYYVQRMFALNQGNTYLPTEVEAPVIEPTYTGGMIGLGTWNTAAEFKDILVTSPDGKVLLKPDFSKGIGDWKLLGGGEWTAKDGVLRQTAEKNFIRALAGDKTWKDYTISLKARKLSGSEGFQVLFRVANEEDRRWWNIGGWNNTQNAVEVESAIDGKPGRIETDRWYDIKVSVEGKRVKCWLDGQLIHDIDYVSTDLYSTVYATSAADTKTGDIIVKVVNTAAEPMPAELSFNQAKLTGKGTAEVLTSDKPEDENSVTEPTRVAPKSESVSFTGSALKRVLPGNSLTVLRLHTSR